jgi:anti-sigma regulatory factor (Ser/Thr protein kinase)
MSATSPFTTHARTDGRDWLVEADEPLAGLQLRNGGELPGIIVAPALLELVRKVRLSGHRQSAAIRAQDDEELITAWVEVEPDDVGGGCHLAVSNWMSDTARPQSSRIERERQVALARQFAELTARLDSKQCLLAVESQCQELHGLLVRMREGLGRPWTDFVKLDGNAHQQPTHWRLLDGASLSLQGSDRRWTALLVPLGRPVPGRDGFELYLSADRVLADVPAADVDPVRQDADDALPGIGPQIMPVLRQPVSRIIANAEAIRAQLAGPLADEYSNYARDIASAGEHLLSLVDDMTTLEMVEGESLDLVIEPIDLADIARRAAGILRVRASERKIAIDIPKEGERAPAMGEFGRVLQVLFNLLDNAIRYTPEGSQIWLRVESEAGVSRVTVADQGMGLDVDQQKRIFDKFERLGRSSDGGSGLGLYISRRLAEAMGGSLTVESSKGQGARFTLELPTGG